jgi:serine/threonine protein kinase
MNEECRRTCPACGTELSGAMKFCPVCMLHRALGREGESGESALEHAVEPTREFVSHRFDHYELVTGDDGKPIELGRGAMGVTYKAFDVELRRPVTLKVISEQYLDDESARLRFLREARAAAKVRHTNVASVFHLGRSGGKYFYAMEFVEGETLESLVKRYGRLEVKVALEIVTQVAAGLVAVHKQKLVHRDIKPGNIMVSVEEASILTAKIIDLGLAKSAPDAPAEAAISTPGAFAGTPAFASPEQFSGLGVDIRSDLYSLGVVLWEMLTGRAVFQGSAAEVMYQHQRAPLPLEELDHVPQPVVVLLGVLLRKDPAQRFQSPSELLKAIPTVTRAIDTRRRITLKSLQKSGSTDFGVGTGKPPGRLGPKKISIGRLPVTGSDIFGREEDIGFLDRAWANKDVNVVTVVAWAGVGKSTLINHWLRQMAAKGYRGAELVFGWSFYRQGSSEGTSSADEFLDTTLSWFGDQDPLLGTAWEKGERLARLIAHRRTLLVLDGLEPLQNPPGFQEGRVRELCLQALLRELAAFNQGLCIITTRLPVLDVADHDDSCALRRDLEQLSGNAGAKLLRALGVKGSEADLQTASDEFHGHCLALTLLGSYLTDAYEGDIRCREEVSKRLAYDVRQGAHARKVMESYQAWFGEGPELSVLRLLGLFDRPADEKAIEVLLDSPAIPGLTESLVGMRSGKWRTILASLRRARLLAADDPYNPGELDTHPLVREYFGEQLRNQRAGAWQECNRRLYGHYRTLAPPFPESISHMEPLFLAVVSGCQAGLLRDALHEVYLPRIQRGTASFAAKVLGIRGALVSALAHFFENGKWGSPMQTNVEGQGLTAEDQLLILEQTGLHLTATRGLGASEARICYERAESFSYSLNRPLSLYSALMGQWLFSLHTDKLSATIQIAKRIYSLAQEQNNSTLMVGACRAMAGTLHFMGDFEAARRYARDGIQLWSAKGTTAQVEEVLASAVGCLFYGGLTIWHLGDVALSNATMAKAISLAKELNDTHGLAAALNCAAMLGHFARNPVEVERCSSDLIELSTQQTFRFWLAGGEILRGWARSASGSTAEGIAWIEDGIVDWRASGSKLLMPYWLGLKAEALHLGDRTSEALEAIKEAEKVVERSEERQWCAEMHRLRGVFLATLGADEAQIEASLCAALRTARDQKSVSLAARAEGTYAEYLRQKTGVSGRHVFRLPLC